jgi:hypothetical protein
MLIPLLLAVALFSADRSTDPGAAGLRQVQPASSTLRSDHNSGTDDFEREVAAENLEEEGEEDALPCAPCGLLGELGMPPYLRDSRHAPLLVTFGSRHRPQRAPPAR